TCQRRCRIGVARVRGRLDRTGFRLRRGRRPADGGRRATGRARGAYAAVEKAAFVSSGLTSRRVTRGLWETGRREWSSRAVQVLVRAGHGRHSGRGELAGAGVRGGGRHATVHGAW